MTTRTVRCLLLAATALAVPGASRAAAEAGGQSRPVHLDYDAYFSGLNVAKMQASFDLSPATYRMQLSYRMSGAVGAIWSGHGTSTVDGRFQGDQALPRELFSSGEMRGRTRVTQIDYGAGKPTLTQLEPPVEPEREPVPVAEQAGSIDSLSAMAILLHRVWTTGRCEGAVRTFDGRWLSRVEARTVGEEQLPDTSRSVFGGTALRCDITGQQLAGFTRDADPATLRRPHQASVWFARTLPGGPVLPVRIAIQTRGFGEATLYLTGAS